MGKERDLSRSRERIFDAALQEFSARGFAGARTSAIARRAAINEQMIFHCFGSKDGLYREVLHREMARISTLLESRLRKEAKRFSKLRGTNLVAAQRALAHEYEHVRQSGGETAYAQSGRPSIPEIYFAEQLLDRAITPIFESRHFATPGRPRNGLRMNPQEGRYFRDS
jgi:AcrR family transcriptional regulator